MQPDRLSDEQLDELAAELAPRLPTGTHGDRVILPRRQFVGALGGTLGAGALMALGVDRAAAEAAGQQGTAEDPNDMFAWDLDVQNGAEFNGTHIEGVGSVSAGEVNSVEWQTEDRSLSDALTSAGEDGTVIITADEDTSAFDNDVQDGQTVIGMGGKITDSSINVVPANNVSFIGVDVEVNRDGTAIRFNGNGVLIDSCRVENLAGESNSRGLEIGESNKFTITSCHCKADDSAIGVIFSDAENGSIGDNIADGGITIDGGATNINKSNNTVI